MRVLRHYSDLPAEALGAVVVLGNFDGLHRGHQAVLNEARAVANRLAAPLALITFEPHPRRFFTPDRPPFRLSSLRTKALVLEALGVDFLLALHFDKALAAMSAEDFVMAVLVKGLKARHVVVGYDFVFGHKRGGGVPLLSWMAEMEGFGLSVVEAAGAGGEIFSSTRIRQHLSEARPQDAADLLGRWWCIEGRVLPGDKRGRTIGFPTANIALYEYLVPALGVYAVRAGIEGERAIAWHDGVANLGRRPTFAKEDVLLEVHLLDFDGDLYGRHLLVQFVDFIRQERKFDGIAALKAQIAADAGKARVILADPANQDGKRFAHPN